MHPFAVWQVSCLLPTPKPTPHALTQARGRLLRALCRCQGVNFVFVSLSLHYLFIIPTTTQTKGHAHHKVRYTQTKRSHLNLLLSTAHVFAYLSWVVICYLLKIKGI